jgi:tryptophan synthase alpha chain
MSDLQPHEKISVAIENAVAIGRVGLVPYITAGYPKKNQFIQTLRQVAVSGDVVEVGVPFSDPMADGVTIQRASHLAISHGVSLRWILEQLSQAGELDAPVVLMSYMNPLLAFGFKELADASLASHVSGFIVPDLPLEECTELKTALEARGVALIQLVTPATPEDRMEALCHASSGFIYAVTIKGITGGTTALPAEVTGYLDRVKSHAKIPVCAGFGVRTPEQVENLGAHADGIVVGSALVERLEAGEEPADFLNSLR